MLEVTTSGSHSHVGYTVKLMIKFATALLMRLCGSSPQQLSTLWLEFTVLFQHNTPNRYASQVGSNLESFSDPGSVRLQPGQHDARTLRNGGCLG